MLGALQASALRTELEQLKAVHNKTAKELVKVRVLLHSSDGDPRGHRFKPQQRHLTRPLLRAPERVTSAQKA